MAVPFERVVSMVLSLRAQQRLDRAAFIHRAVALRHLFQGQGQVEDLGWIDLSAHDLMMASVGSIIAGSGHSSFVF